MQSIKKEYSRDVNNLIVGEIPESRLSGTREFQWQKSFYDHVIRDEKDLHEHISYTRYNFQKHNLPSDWRYTSLNIPDMIDEINT